MQRKNSKAEQKQNRGLGKWHGIYLVIIVLLLGFSAVLFYDRHRIYAEEQNLLQAYTNASIPEIVCIGDSLTAGTGGEGVSYPSYLQELLWEDSLYIPVRNLGVGGENTVTIAARVSALPFKVNSFTIPTDNTPVEISFLADEGKRIEPLRQGEAGINPCKIAGVEGLLSIEQENPWSAEHTYYFTRSQSGEAVKVEEGATVETNAKNACKDGIFIVFMGENGGFDSIEELIIHQKAILALQEKNKDKYIIVGMTSGTAAERAEVEAAMQAEYGAHYVNLREYLSSEGVYDAGIEPTENDLLQMEEGKIPDCLLSDDVHFTKQGYMVIAEKLYAHMKELGYFDDVMDAVELYGKEF